MLYHSELIQNILIIFMNHILRYDLLIASQLEMEMHLQLLATIPLNEKNC